ncbi:MAG: hypothetical protein QGG40_08420, partial [Myxococcota bacterium]|nr:hypothetical protein [Myxococcota bacterium]
MMLSLSWLLPLVSGCLSPLSEGLAPATPADTTVKMDFFHRPLPEIPLPNDIATRYDGSSATGRRVNASMVAPTQLEVRVRTLLDNLDGWGVMQPITVPFTGPLDVDSVIAAHRDTDYDTSDDVVYLVDIDPDSPEFGEVQLLDLGNGNYPVVVQETDGYWANDPRESTLSILFEETDEDLDGNGVLDPGEDSDADGVLDVPNYLPGHDPAPDDMGARADALMTFYERETNTLIAKPLVPLRERTTYAFVVTRRLVDEAGSPVGSPYPWINHSSQTTELEPLLDVLPDGLSVEDIAYTFPFTTQSVQSHWQALRDGLYGEGVQAHLGEEFPPEVTEVFELRDTAYFPDATNSYLLYGEQFKEAFLDIYAEIAGKDMDTREFEVFNESMDYVDYQIIGSFDS